MNGPRRISAWKRLPERPFVLGHRGARRRAPENTLRAFDLAMDEGADGVELDVRLNADGAVIVLHDRDLSRVTSGQDTRHAEELRGTELSGTDLGQGETVPLLSEVLRWSRLRRARINIELKSDVTHRARFVLAVARLVATEPHARERFIFSSFDPRLVAAMAYLVPWVPAGWLIEKSRPIPRHVGAARLVRAAAVHPHYSLVTQDSVRPWADAGLAVNVWTVNEASDARRLSTLGVDTLITDEPGKTLAALQERSG